MGKQTKKKKSTGAAKEIFAKAPGRLGKWNAIAFAVLVVGELIYYYAATPAINIQSTSFWVWLIIQQHWLVFVHLILQWRAMLTGVSQRKQRNRQHG